MALNMAGDHASKFHFVSQKMNSLETMVEGVLQRFNNLESSISGIKREVATRMISRRLPRLRSPADHADYGHTQTMQTADRIDRADWAKTYLLPHY